MRILNVGDRLHLQGPDGIIDVEIASSGRFGHDPQQIYDHWVDFVAWSREMLSTTPARSAASPPTVPPSQYGSPAPRPRQVFAVGLNYQEHADESGFVRPSQPVIFTKFASSITGPITTVELPDGDVDWEVELVVVIGRGGRDIESAHAWDCVAGVTVGQDLSERQRQHSGPAPQFSLAKSHRGFSPMGPALVSIDELGDPNDLEIGATIDEDTVQHGRTSQLIFPVPELIANLSSVVELYPGDVIFTGTPSGVGAGRNPPRFLRAGNVLRSYIVGVGELEQTFVTAQLLDHDEVPALATAAKN